MIEKIPKFNYGKVQPVAFDDGMTLYEEVAKISDSQNNLVDMFNNEDFTNIVHQDDLTPIRQQITNNTHEIESLTDEAVLKSELLQEPVRTGQQALSAYASMQYTDDEIAKITTDYVKSENVKQTLGTSTTDVMSQNAITEALSNINNTVIVNESFIDNTRQSASWAGTRHNILSLPNYTQTATGTIISSNPPLVGAPFALKITTRDKDNMVVDEINIGVSSTSPVNFSIMLSPLATSIQLTGIVSAETTLTTTLSYQKIADNSLLQSTGNSTTQAMSQKAVTDAINQYGYDFILLTQENKTTPLEGIYDKYETNTLFAYQDTQTLFGLIKLGNHSLIGINRTDHNNINFNLITINNDDTIAVSITSRYAKISAHTTSPDYIYTSSYINRVLPQYKTASFSITMDNAVAGSLQKVHFINSTFKPNDDSIIIGLYNSYVGAVVPVFTGIIKTNGEGYFTTTTQSLPSFPTTAQMNNVILIPISQ